jgi:glycosyltransferase involved in cell wall biosynthesis
MTRATRVTRIGVNALYLIPGGVGGTEIYLRELLAALARIDSENEYFVFTNFETGADLVPRQANFHWKPQAVRASLRPARILWEQIVLPLEVSRYRIDVLFNPGFTSPIFVPCRSVTVFHDLQHKQHPEHFRWFDLPFWRFLLWASARRSSAMIAVSKATEADLARVYPFTEGRVTVIAHGVDAAFFALERRTIEPYVLCVSTLHPHKNLDRLIRAFARRERGCKLVIAGMRGFHASQIEALIAELGARVELTGWVARKDLMRLYEHARAFIYPSTFEGFGMPVLEAMATGVPVACSDIPPLHEVGGDAVLYFDPLNEDAISEALDRVVDFVGNGRERARRFRWETSAEMTLDVLRG